MACGTGVIRDPDAVALFRSGLLQDGPDGQGDMLCLAGELLQVTGW